jgi:hypothetical protein
VEGELGPAGEHALDALRRGLGRRAAYIEYLSQGNVTTTAAYRAQWEVARLIHRRDDPTTKCVSPKRPGLGKKKYRSRAAAMKFLRRSSPKVRDAKVAYLCPRCGWWHLTSADQRPVDGETG